MNIIFVTPEMEPLVKVGGLADVVSALSLALARTGDEVSVIMPRYSGINIPRGRIKDTGVTISVPLDGDVWKGTVSAYRHDGVLVYLVGNPKLFDREGTYGVDGTDYTDNAIRFAFLARGALEVSKALHLKPDIFHIHDWQTALLPVFKKLYYQVEKEIGRAGVVMSIHNLAYQGLFESEFVTRLGLPWDIFNLQGLEFYGQLSFLKGGLVHSDLLTTVSPTYAKEIQTREYGAGLHGLLRQRADDLVGILNGIDISVWNPQTDGDLFAPYSAGDPSGKAKNKKRLQELLGLAVSEEKPLFGCVARLDPQKGFDLVLEAAPTLLGEGAQLVILGSGRKEYLDAFRALAKTYPDKLSLNEGFQRELAPKIYAGSDFFLMPSRYEPCGLGQMIALRYGTIPVVRRTGGLADTIKDIDQNQRKGNGYVFEKYETSALLEAFRRAMAGFKNSKTWNELVLRAMKEDLSWKHSVDSYKDVYAHAAGKSKARSLK